MFDAIGRDIAQVTGQLHEADRVSQINTGALAIEQAFSLYNRDLTKKKWDRPAGADGALIPYTFGQIDENELAADHAAQVKTVEDIVARTTTNKAARDYLTNLVQQKANANYSQVWNSWFTEHNIELVGQSDANIASIVGSNKTPEGKKAAIAQQLNTDAGSGIRRAADVARYRQTVEQQIDSSWAFGSAIEVAKKAGYSADASDLWLDQNTAFWNGDPTKRQAAKVAVRQEVEYQKGQKDAADNQFLEDTNMAWAKMSIGAGNNSGILRQMLGVLQTGGKGTITVNGEQRELSGDFGKAGQSAATAIYWNDRLGRLIEGIENPPKVDTAARDTWQADNYSYAVMQLTMAQAGIDPKTGMPRAGGPANSGELLKMINEFNLTTDANGKPVIRFKGEDLAKLYRDFGTMETTEAYKLGETTINNRAKELKLSTQDIGNALVAWRQAYRQNPDAEEADIITGALNIVNGLLRQNISRDIAATGGWLSGEAKLTADEQALKDAADGRFKFMVGEDPANLPYFNQLASVWLARAQKDFPKAGITYARPEDTGIYGPEGTPLMFDKDENVYRYVMEGNQAVLQKRVKTRLGEYEWQPVMAAGVAQPVKPVPIRPGKQGTTTTGKVVVLADWVKQPDGNWYPRKPDATGLSKKATPEVAKILDELKGK